MCIREDSNHDGGYSLISCGRPMPVHLMDVDDGVLHGLTVLIRDDEACAALPARMDTAFAGVFFSQGLTGPRWADGTYEVRLSTIIGSCSLKGSTVAP